MFRPITASLQLALAVTASLLVMACSSSSSSGGPCSSHNGEGINHAAIAWTSGNSPNNACQELHQYNLFEPNPDEGFTRGDPRRPLVVEGEYQGLPYALNTTLFSDYTAKHRIVFLPKDEEGNFIPATYRDANGSPDGVAGVGELGKANDALVFPVGTVIAKSFTYPDTSGAEPAERIIETRLLIKHANGSPAFDGEGWEGVTYVWSQDEATGEWIARRQNTGGFYDEARNWSYPDPNKPGEATISGSVNAGEDGYLIPSRGNCLTCHQNPDQDAGAAPIGPKARNLNRPYASEFAQFTNDPAGLVGNNQIDFWAAQGWLSDIDPAAYTLDTNTQLITDIERIQPYNVPADSNNASDDLGDRARGYLAVNCAHCHNEVRGSVEDMYLEFQRTLCDANHAIGEGKIEPGNSANSNLHGRINAKGDTNPPAGDPMPRLARQLIHDEGVSVVAEWIDSMATDICP